MTSPVLKELCSVFINVPLTWAKNSNDALASAIDTMGLLLKGPKVPIANVLVGRLAGWQR
jgi:hypothetical protein